MNISKLRPYDRQVLIRLGMHGESCPELAAHFSTEHEPMRALIKRLCAKVTEAGGITIDDKKHQPVNGITKLAVWAQKHMPQLIKLPDEHTVPAKPRRKGVRA